MAIKSGQIVLFKFPQTNLVLGRNRPALLLVSLPTAYNDWLVCMISSKTHQAVTGIDELISTTDTDFSQSGLKSESVIRLTRLAVVSDSILLGNIDEVSSIRLKRLKKNLADWIETS
ncbi:MAG: type II toxin-antitoxin system PemK/MazF family toxin [Acidobacteriota bacterium]|jgi:mRNA interferase MazF|nr:type II toxin-antitoxin system PemK/MazF family toxin [Acidobacteriota bacterium]